MNNIINLKSVGAKVGLLALSLMLIFQSTAVGTPVEWIEDPDNAPELRLQLGGLFGEYALLNASFAMAMIDENNETARNELSSLDALRSNIEDINSKIEEVVGVEQSVLFQLSLEAHQESYFNYVLAIKTNNITNQELYREMLIEDQKDMYQLIKDWNLNHQEIMIQDSLRNATNELLDAVDNYALENFAESYSAIRQSHREMGRFGELLADGLAHKYSQTYKGEFYSAQSDFHLRMARDFGEHAYFASIAVKNKLNGNEDRLNQSKEVLQENTNDISDSIANNYGFIEGISFETLWKRHTEDVLNYAGTLASESDNNNSDAIEEYYSAHEDLVNFLLNLNSDIDGKLIVSIQDGHGYNVQLMGAHLSTGDYENGFEAIRNAYANAFQTGYALGQTITEQFPNKYMIDKTVNDENKAIIHLDEKMTSKNSGTFNLADEPRIIEGSTYLSINSLERIVNADIDWHAMTETIKMVTSDNKQVTIYENIVTLEGERVPTVLDKKMIIESDTVWIPLRALADNLGWDISYDAKTQDVILNY